jgi:hypothetical protein
MTEQHNLATYEGLKEAFLEQKQRAEAAEEQVKRLRDALVLIYDKWENGDPCFELSDGGTVDENGSSLGNAFKLSLEEEQEILNLIVDKAESFEQACANCGKPYRAHLLHDGTKCAPNSTSGWFPKQIADALLAMRGKGKP